MYRIAIIIGKMNSGGKKNLIMEYYRNIDHNKIQFDFICDKDSNSIPYEEIEELGGRVILIEPYQSILKNMQDLYRIFNSGEYKIVHAYNGTMNLFSLFIAKICGIPIRINESISMAHKKDKKTILKVILKPFSKLFSTHYMANGIECGKWQFGEKLYSNGEIAIFKSIIDSEKNRFDLQIRNETRKQIECEENLIVGHIGRITEQKNTLFIIDIFNEIHKMDSSVKLLIIGDGNLKKKMLIKIDQMHLEKYVIYLGRTEEIAKYYNAMDCFLLPSLYEGVPIAGIEAENCGLPVFFSDAISVESGVCEDLSFFISLNDGAQLWAKKILEITKQKMAVRNDHSEAIKENGFDAKSEAIKLQNYYLSLLN